jgi:HEPN domain-containing protein
VLLEDVSFHAQQCAEKALKALLLARSIDFPRTHSIAILLDLLKRAGVAVPEPVDEAFSLTQYAVATRYPGVWDAVSEDEARVALGTAAYVLDWATMQITSPSLE